MTREQKRRASFEDISSDTTKQAYKKNKKRQKRIGTMIVLCFLFSLLFLLGSGLMGVSALMLNDLTTTVIEQDDESLGILPENKENGVLNIALFGVIPERTGDTLIGACSKAAILSVDLKNDTIKLVSVSSDILTELDEVSFAEEGKDTLSKSYVYGGPVCAIRALNDTFALDIHDYIAVNLSGAEQILSAFGVDSAAENISVTEAILNCISTMPKEEYPRVLAQVLELTETSLTVGDMLRLSAVFTDPFTVERTVIPGETVPGENLMKNDAPAVLLDRKQAAEAVRDFLYDSKKINSCSTEVAAISSTER